MVVEQVEVGWSVCGEGEPEFWNRHGWGVKLVTYVIRLRRQGGSTCSSLGCLPLSHSCLKQGCGICVGFTLSFQHNSKTVETVRLLPYDLVAQILYNSAQRTPTRPL